ncbi:hypothetical protein, partial [Synergistes jonesii]|uniref:hypothetical protein n=1 Tax=Synergistes jonesii TaxID=2754 RepID=UPI00331C4200
ISAFLSGVSFLCLAIKISSWIEFILTPIQEACFLLYGVYTEFVILSHKCPESAFSVVLLYQIVDFFAAAG